MQEYEAWIEGPKGTRIIHVFTEGVHAAHDAAVQQLEDGEFVRGVIEIKKPFLGRAVPCIRCGRKLKGLPDSENQANDGLYFRTWGAYGTRVYDPMDGHFIEINVCDECLVEAGRHGRVLEGMSDSQEPLQVWGREDVDPGLYDIESSEAD